MTQVPAAMVDSISFTEKWNYDVFLSFRGADTRNKFLGHLYAELIRRGVHTFKDDKDLKRGAEISASLLKSIGESRISIIIFSKQYASSTWCLEELVHILKCRREKKQHVLPVFYDVEPTEIRNHQSGSFGLAMVGHEKRFQSNIEKVKVHNWKLALKEAANLAGLEFKDGDNEHSFLQMIIKEVTTKLSRALLHVADHPVGLKSPILKVKSQLNIESGGVLTFRIHGIGGSGKTTLAKAVYNLIADEFEGCTCFLAKIRENSIPQLQEQLLVEILGDKNIKLRGDSSKGISLIGQRLGTKKVLLVLDDVDNLDQLKALAGKQDWFGGGSRIIITTRNKGLQVNHVHDVTKTFEMKLLNDHEALQLLNWHAFTNRIPDIGYADISKRVVDYSKGLPLALEKIGLALVGRSIQEWESALHQYERNLHGEIFNVLRKSYDDLKNNVKKIFLDIACFFEGETWESVEKTYQASDFTRACIGELQEKSLVTIDKHDKLRMHNVIRHMGREFVRQESEDPTKRSRLWFQEEVLQLIKDNKGTDKVEGIKLDLCEQGEVEWNRNAFKEMKNLRILIIRNTYFKGGPKHLPDNLRLLEWQGYSSQLLPDDFREEKLVILRLTYSRFMLEDLKEFKNLMIMNLNGCKFSEVPDLSQFQNLKELHLDGCENLTDIHVSVGFLAKLVMLSAERCTKLKIFPVDIKLPSLKYLNFRSCNQLELFPNVLVKMENVTWIDLCYTAVKELPSSIENLVGLQELRLSFCKRLKDLPSSIYKLENLSSLELEGCQEVMHSRKLSSKYTSKKIPRYLTALNIRSCDLSDRDLPMISRCFRYLKMLDLSANNFVNFSDCIIELVSLECLRLNNCKQLQSIPRDILPRLKIIDAFNCTLLNLELSSSSLSQGFKEARVPGTSIPQGFHHCSEGDCVSFWVYEKLPEIIVAFALEVKNVDLLEHPASVCLLINGIKVLQAPSPIIHKLDIDHVWLFDLRNHFSKEELVDFDSYLEDGWNQMKVSFQSQTLTANWCGVHVHKNGLNSNDVLFRSPAPQDSGTSSQSFRPNNMEKEQKVVKELEQLSMNFNERAKTGSGPDNPLDVSEISVYPNEKMPQILLHGTLHAKIYEVDKLYSRGGSKFRTSKLYATIDLEKARSGRTRILESQQSNPRWYESFHIYCAHMASNIVFTVKDDNPTGAKLIGRAYVPVEEILAGEEVDKWVEILDEEKNPIHGGSKIHVKLQYFDVTKDRNWDRGIRSRKFPGVPYTFNSQRQGCRVNLYQDAHVPDNFIPRIPLAGGEYYEPHRCWEDIFDAITNAQHLIYITGWSVYTEISLVRDSRRQKPEGDLTIGELLKKKASEGVRVLMLVWDDRTSVGLLKKDRLMATHGEETERYFRYTDVHCILCPRNPDDGESIVQIFTHHQKIVVVDSEMPSDESYMRRIESFVGGIDLCEGRYDTQFHSLFRTLGTAHYADFHQPNFPSASITKGGPREPWHDIHSRLEGPIAWDVLFSFEQRWRKQGGNYRLLVQLSELDDFINPHFPVTFPNDQDTWNVQLFSSIDSGAAFGFPETPEEAARAGLVSGKDNIIDRSIQDAYINAIRRAKNFIYIENQFFLGSSFAWSAEDIKPEDIGALHLIPKELSLKIASKIEAGERFTVYVLVPMWPEGNPESASVQAILDWQKRTLEMMYKDVIQALRANGLEEDPRNYLTFFCLGNREVKSRKEYEPSEKPDEDSNYMRAQEARRFMIYVHSKMMIVDDEYIIIGSANINQRSMDGARDSEIAMGAYQPYHLSTRQPARGQIHGFRMALWYEHLGMLDVTFLEPESEDCVQEVNRLADKYWDLFSSESLERDLPGHLLRYPIGISSGGDVTELPGCEFFPDTKARILGGKADYLPPIFTS